MRDEARRASGTARPSSFRPVVARHVNVFMLETAIELEKFIKSKRSDKSPPPTELLSLAEVSSPVGAPRHQLRASICNSGNWWLLAADRLRRRHRIRTPSSSSRQCTNGGRSMQMYASKRQLVEKMSSTLAVVLSPTAATAEATRMHK